MATRQHHYVPRFYLRLFRSRRRRINIHNIERGLTVPDVSIKHECAKPDYYRTVQIEEALAELEGRAAAVISALCNSANCYDLDTIRRFVAVQLLRTPSASSRTAAAESKFREALGGEPADGEFNSGIPIAAIEPKDFPIYNLLLSDDLANAMRDLKTIVVESDSDAFITSDNPVFKYNQYLEEVQDYGTTGLRQTGLQVFLPLSPRHILVMYDKDVYDYIKKQPPTEADIEVLNGLQVISASNNLYFNDIGQSYAIEKLASGYAYLRRKAPMIVDELSSNEKPQSFLVHGYQQTLNVGLNLSFLRIKRRAGRLSISRRLRNTFRSPYRRPTSKRRGATETFSTRVARF